MGVEIVAERRIAVEDGDLTSAGPWVYVWRRGHEILYVGATSLPPEVRTWLHLHDESPDVGRVRAERPDALVGPVEVCAFRLAEGVDRQQVKRALLAFTGGPGGGPEAAGEERAAGEIIRRLGLG
jgi:hypothetical protein